MPWCPVCKNEYREGIEFCAECKAALVESLEEEVYQPFTFGEQEKMIRLQDFLNYGDAGIETKLTQDEEEHIYRLSVRDCDRKNAVKAAQVFLAGEASAQVEETTQEPSQDNEEKQPQSYHYYQNSAARAEDNRSSAYTLLVVGGMGFAAVLLVFFNVIPFYRNAGINKYLVCGIMGAMFILFLVFGVLSMRNSKVLFVKANTENSLLAEMTRWCEANLNAEALDAELFQGEEVAEEQKYFIRAERMKELINDKFLNLDEAFVEHFVDEYYQELFENT